MKPAEETGKGKYKPGFFCALFWLLTWAGIAGMIALGIVASLTGRDLLEWFFPLAAGTIASAVVSYLIRSAEKSRHDGRRSLHWND